MKAEPNHGINELVQVDELAIALAVAPAGTGIASPPLMSILAMRRL